MMPAELPPSSQDALAAPGHLRDSRIVVADDDVGVIQMLKRLLARAGYRHVWTTTRGAEVATLCAEVEPDLVILDLLMPDRRGLEVVREVKTLDGGAVPILVVSGEEGGTAVQQALAAGARDFLSKPFEPGEALLRIRNLLEVRALHTRSLAAAEARYRTLVEGASELICQPGGAAAHQPGVQRGQVLAPRRRPLAARRAGGRRAVRDRARVGARNSGGEAGIHLRALPAGGLVRQPRKGRNRTGASHLPEHHAPSWRANLG